MKVALLVGLVGVASATGCRESTSLDPMASQRRYGAYEASSFFDDGRAMQQPPPGTVPFGTAEESPPSRPAVTRELLQRGRNRFEIYCATCHGLLGDGRSLVAANMALRPAPSLQAPQYRARDPEWFHAVATDGFGLMPSYAAQLTDEERWAVAFYVKALQRSQWAPIEAAPPDVRARLEADQP